MTGRICGTGSCVPSFAMDNNDIAKLVDTSDEWIRERTGVVRRHIIKEETTVSMAAEAGRQALENAGIAAEDVDLIIVSTISSKAAAEGGLVTIYPIGSNVKSYSLIMGDSAFWNSFWISIKRVVIGTVWTMVVLIMMSYPLAKSKTEYKPRNVLMWILVFCMLFNGGTIPWFITVKNYGMIDTMAALVLAGSVPVFNVLLMMNFFRGIPGDLEEAARVDGAGPWRILWQIVVPCSKPVIATIVLFTSVGYWNEYFQGLVLMNKETNYPLQTYIRQISVQIPVGVTLTAEQYQQLAQNSNKSLEAAKVFIALVPMLIVYPFLQKYFVTGITLGAVKE